MPGQDAAAAVAEAIERVAEASCAAAKVATALAPIRECPQEVIDLLADVLSAQTAAHRALARASGRRWVRPAMTLIDSGS